jgi:hypothetical protein
LLHRRHPPENRAPIGLIFLLALKSLPLNLRFSDGNGGPNLKDPLQVPDGPITRSRAKMIKEAMQGLMQSTWAEFANLSSKAPTFKLGLKEEEPTLIHVV